MASDIGSCPTVGFHINGVASIGFCYKSVGPNVIYDLYFVDTKNIHRQGEMKAEY
jgi:hypothetical protein